MAKKKKSKQQRLPKGVPSPDTIVDEFDMRIPGGQVIRVRRTNQKDAYDPPDSPGPPKRKRRRRAR